MRSIRRRLIRQLLWGSAVLLGVGGVAVYVWTRAALIHQFDATLQATATAIRAVTTDDEGHIAVDETGIDLAGGAATQGPFYGVWRQRDGVLVASSDPRRDDVVRVPAASDQPRFWDVVGQPFGARAVAVTFRPRPTLEDREEQAAAPQTDLVLMVAASRKDLDRTLATLALVLAGTGGLLLGTTMVTVPRLLIREFAPVDELATRTASIGAASLSTRLPTLDLPEELVPIAVTLNALLERLDDAFERERRFSADVAHELRTPISELRATAELALTWPDTRGPETDRDVLAIARQMEGMVSRLLALLRSERGELALCPSRLDLGRLMRRAWMPFEETAATKGLAVDWTLPDDAWIDVDAVLLRSVITNLVENAVEYTPPDGAVWIGCEVEADAFAIRVRNTTSGPAPVDVSRMFDRFWRGEAPRGQGAHSGLGLTIARSFAEAMGCRLCGDADDSTLEMTVTGPRRSSARVARA